LEFFERPAGGEKAVLVHLDMRAERQDEDLEEFRLLAGSAGVETVAVVRGARQRPDPKFFAGTGKVERSAGWSRRRRRRWCSSTMR